MNWYSVPNRNIETHNQILTNVTTSICYTKDAIPLILSINYYPSQSAFQSKGRGIITRARKIYQLKITINRGNNKSDPTKKIAERFE